VSVIGDFNGLQVEHHVLHRRDDDSGLWEGFISGPAIGDCYKFHITGPGGEVAEKADLFARYAEEPPCSASRLWKLDYAWSDGDWMAGRFTVNALNAPISTYEVHQGSWRRVPEEGNRFLSYREVVPRLASYVKEMGFTHVELLPLTEHPFYGSWGYQTTGYFAPTARYGPPQDLMFLIDTLHQASIGVIFDWAPAHFPDDGHGLFYFDGTCLYEHVDSHQGFHPDWKSSIFNFGRHKVRAFLISSAFFWFDKYHVDGLRIDAVASMLYLDYGRKEGEWIPNVPGGRENLEAISFLRSLNEAVYRDYPDIQTIAEESTAWPMVFRPTCMGGLGFGMKWNMGWMHDTLKYFQQEPLFREYRYYHLTFGLCHALTENFVLPLSHDEVVYGKGTLLSKMPGDEWQQFANLRLLYGLMWTHPGKKLLFMGGEFWQKCEWQHEESLEWQVLQYLLHECVQRWVADLNHVYREQAALHDRDFTSDGFAWVSSYARKKSVIGFLRYGGYLGDVVLVVCNFTPIPRHNNIVGVPRGGQWEEILNSDANYYGGSGMSNFGRFEATLLVSQGYSCSLSLTLPPLAALVLKPATRSGGTS